MPGTEEKLINVMESNTDFGSAGVENNVVTVSLLVYFQWFSTIHRKLFKFLIFALKASIILPILSNFIFNSLR